MKSAVNYQDQKPNGSRELHRDLIASRSLPRPGEDWLWKVETVHAMVSPDARLVMYSDPYSMGADRFRLLRTHVYARGRANKIKVLMVTSALPHEGKTMTALNLAIGLAEGEGSTVALVEADLRHPALADRLGLAPEPGLVDCLQEGKDPLSALRRMSPLGIYMLHAGRVANNPIELLNSEGFAKAILKLRAAVDWVVIDAPPTIPVPDVLDLRSHVDACVWVMRAHSTPRELIRDAIHQIGPDMIIGTVLNEADDLQKSYSNYYNAPGPLILTTGE